jgi:hypothetical protein
MSTTYPTTILGFASYIVKALAWLVSQEVRLGIDPAQILALKALYGDDTTPGTYVYCKLQYDLASGRKDTIVTTNLETITDKVKAKLTEIYNDIPASKWTDADRNTLNRKTGLPHVLTKPEAKIEAVCILDIAAYANGLFGISGREHEDSKRSNLPDGADALELAYAYIESPVRKADPSLTAGKVKKECLGPDDDTFREILFKSKGELKVDAQYAGYNIVIWGRWINTKYPKLSGNWSIRYTLMITLA